MNTYTESDIEDAEANLWYASLNITEYRNLENFVGKYTSTAAYQQ